MAEEQTTADSLPAGETPPVQPAPGQGDTAPSESVTSPPEGDTPPEPSNDEPAPLTEAQQRMVDAATGKRLAQARRAWEREAAQARTQSQPQIDTGGLSIDQFETPEQYAVALATRLDEQREERRVLDAYNAREDEAREKYEDYDAVAHNQQLAVSVTMAKVIRASEIGADVAYYLGKNPEESARIARNPDPLAQAKAIGEIEAKLRSTPPVKKVTNAPPPINPTRSRSGTPPVIDTTDPKAAETLSVDEWMAQENARERRVREARVH